MHPASERESLLNRFRRHPRVRVPTPFICSVSPLRPRSWFRRSEDDIGVVYDLSLRGVRMSTAAAMKPGDRVTLRLRLPKQAAPAEIAVATVRWTKDHVYGLAFQTLSRSAHGRLRKYMALAVPTQ